MSCGKLSRHRGKINASHDCLEDSAALAAVSFLNEILERMNFDDSHSPMADVAGKAIAVANLARDGFIRPSTGEVIYGDDVYRMFYDDVGDGMDTVEGVMGQTLARAISGHPHEEISEATIVFDFRGTAANTVASFPNPARENPFLLGLHYTWRRAMASVGVSQ